MPNCNTSEASKKAVHDWILVQNGQHIFNTTPTVLLGTRLQIYRSEGTTQWFSAIATKYKVETNVSVIYYTIDFLFLIVLFGRLFDFFYSG